MSRAAQSSGQAQVLKVNVSWAYTRYTIAMPGSDSYALRAGVGAEVDGRWLHASDYPRGEHFQIRISGHTPTTFNPERIKRQQPSG
jgi:hypothetical protein